MTPCRREDGRELGVGRELTKAQAIDEADDDVSCAGGALREAERVDEARNPQGRRSGGQDVGQGAACVGRSGRTVRRGRLRHGRHALAQPRGRCLGEGRGEVERLGHDISAVGGLGHA